MSTLLNVIAHFETSLVDTIDDSSVSMELASIETPAGDIPAGTYGFTIEEESTARREYIVGVLSGNTVTFASRDVSPINGTTVDSSSDTARQKHRKGQSVKLTNFPALQRLVRLLDGTDDLAAASPLKYDGAVTPISDNELVTKAYVLSVITGGTITSDQIIISGDAGETIAAKDYVYLNETDGEWYLVDATDEATIDGTKKGIAQGAGTDGNAITSGIILEGMDKQITYTAGQEYYAQDGGGALGTAAGTITYLVGVGDANGKLVIKSYATYAPTKDQKAALAGTGTPSATNKFVTEDRIDPLFGDGSDGNIDIDGTNTYSALFSKSGSIYTMLKNIYADDFVIPSGSTLVTDGFKLYVKGTISGAGTVKWGTPNNGSNAATGHPSTSTSNGGAGGALSGSGLLKSSAGGAGADGQASGGLSNPPAASNGADNEPSNGVDGGNGGTGGGGDQTEQSAVAVGGEAIEAQTKFGVGKLGALELVAIAIAGTLALILSSAASAGGGGGGSDDDSSGQAGGGGGAGASGGMVWIAAHTWTGTFTIESIGGDGGNGSIGGQASSDLGGGGGGAGGAGGAAVFIFAVKTWTGAFTLTGGAGGAAGAGQSSGQAGTAGSVGTTGISYEIDYSNLF